ncbi:MAG: DUF1727 domain-containing protein [Hyphomonadaceae bacterium]|nr:DUF1727 domain-containing protein [Clostridia bacterium]
MNIIIAIWVAKAVMVVSRLFGKKGSSAPGAIALKIAPSILKVLSAQIKQEIIVVCGTNGKTTTNNMLGALLQKSGKKTVCNLVGANMVMGIATAFIDASDLFGKVDADFAALEIDEASAMIVFDHLTPHKIVITNLFRDQLDRYGEIDITMRYLQRALVKAPKAKLILNGDDPLTAFFGYKSTHACEYFGVAEDAYIARDEAKEGRFCTHCGSELQYHYFHYSQLGDFYCNACDFCRPPLQFAAINLYFSNGIAFDLKMGDSTLPIAVNYRGFYNIYNILAAVAPALLCGVSHEVVNAVLLAYKPQIGRMESFALQKPLVLNLSKNPAGFNQAITTVLQDPRPKNVMVVINDNAQDGKDISWIWDVDFERLNVDTISHFVLSGVRKEDVAVRMKHALIKRPRITMEGDLKLALQKLLSLKGEVCYVLVNYTALFETQNILKALEKERGNHA